MSCKKNAKHIKQKLTARSQYAVINFLKGVCLLILNCTTALSCPRTFKLMCSASLACNENELGSAPMQKTR